jgi:DNA-binding phage protein
MQHPMTQTIAAKFAILKPLLDERARRLWAAVEARALGRGGISQVAAATGLARATVRAGLQALALPATATVRQTPPERLRRPGGGRKPLGTRDPHLV